MAVKVNPTNAPYLEEEDGQTEMPPLLPRQREAYRTLLAAEPESYTFLGFGGAAGGSKTFFNARVCIELCLGFPGTRILVARQTLVSLKTTTMEEFYRQLPPELIYKRNDSENWVKVRNHSWPPGIYSTVFFRGIEDYQQKGSEAYQAVIIDEASETKREAAEYLITRLRWRLPKMVQQRMAMQCRKIDDIFDLEGKPTGEWRPCGRICPDMVCPIHGSEFIGNGVRYFFIATSNPWPGWFSDWFFKRQGLNTDALPNARVHFIQSLPTDNPFNGPNYVEVLRASLSPDMVKRMVEGRFDVFAGLVYEGFNPDIHAWRGPIPDYVRVIGGLDFGQESSTAHFTTGIVGLVTATGRLIRVDEFKERGPNVYERQALWMQKMQEKWGKPIGKRIEWRGDRSQAVGIKYMKQAGGFFITMSKGGPDSVDAGIKHVAELLNVRQDKYPGSFYLPAGHELGGCPQWEQEMREYARDPDTMKVVKERDDLVDADRYMAELLTPIRGDPSQFTRNALPVMA